MELRRVACAIGPQGEEAVSEEPSAQEQAELDRMLAEEARPVRGASHPLPPPATPAQRRAAQNMTPSQQAAHVGPGSQNRPAAVRDNTLRNGPPALNGKPGAAVRGYGFEQRMQIEKHRQTFIKVHGRDAWNLEELAEWLRQNPQNIQKALP